jgi:hypothetical protein
MDIIEKGKKAMESIIVDSPRNSPKSSEAERGYNFGGLIPFPKAPGSGSRPIEGRMAESLGPSSDPEGSVQSKEGMEVKVIDEH